MATKHVTLEVNSQQYRVQIELDPTIKCAGTYTVGNKTFDLYESEDADEQGHNVWYPAGTSYEDDEELQEDLDKNCWML